MSDTIKTTQNTDDAELDNLLADMQLGGGEETIEEVIEDVDAELEAAVNDAEDADEASIEELELDEATLRAAEADIEREEVYAEQVSTTTTETDAPAKVKAEKKAKKPRTPGTPRVARDLNAVDAKHFVLEGDVSKMDQAAIDQAKTDTMALMPAQKKIAEKFENLFTAIAGGKQPSHYTMMAFALLDKNGTMSSADLVAHYQASGLREGTARSQAGQIMNLFDTVKIAKRNKQVLTLNKDSTIAAVLRSLSA